MAELNLRKGTRFQIEAYGKTWTLTSVKKDGPGCIASRPIQYLGGDIHFTRCYVKPEEVITIIR